MRATIQRVSRAEVTVAGEVVGRIGRGLLVYVGVATDDSPADAAYIVEKIVGLRIFNDSAGKMNLSIGDVGGGVLVISAFTLQADARKGRRPSFEAAAPPEPAEAMYRLVCEGLRARNLPVATGVFRAHMDVSSANDGPICILMDSRRLF